MSPDEAVGVEVFLEDAIEVLVLFGAVGEGGNDLLDLLPQLSLEVGARDKFVPALEGSLGIGVSTVELLEAVLSIAERTRLKGEEGLEATGDFWEGKSYSSSSEMTRFLGDISIFSTMCPAEEGFAADETQAVEVDDLEGFSVIV